MPLMIGGSFAPPLLADLVAHYRSLAKGKGEVGLEMLKLCDMADKFHETPASTRRGTSHPSGRGVHIPLEPEEIERMDPRVPFRHELEKLKVLFDTIPTEQKDLRDAAHHLLWYAGELVLDREPITSDKL